MSAMHAYGHQWSCQLVYNPHLKRGLGLTDGKGTERLWARLRKLIPITRGCSVSMYRVIVIILNEFYPLATETTLVH